jgi:hypothetical protein
VLIRVTQKLLKLLPIALSDDPMRTDRVDTWHANLLVIARQKCVLFTHDQTLYSVFVPRLQKPDWPQLPDLFRQHLQRSLLHEGFDPATIAPLLSQYQSVEFAKTNNRSVLGSMNDAAFRIQFRIDLVGGLDRLDLDALQKELNCAPMKAIEYRNGTEAFQQHLSKK